MYITVSLKVELKASDELDAMEKAIQRAGREAMKEALKQGIKAREKEQEVCPVCTSRHAREEGSKKRVLLTSFGRVEINLRRRRCQTCHHRYRPAESSLRELFGGNMTKELKEVASIVGSSWPYKAASGILYRMAGAQISKEGIRQVTNGEGEKKAKEEIKAAEKILKDAVTMQQIRHQREQNTEKEGKQEAPLLYVGLDGGWIPSREQSGGMEGKIGVIASEVEAVGKVGKHRLAKRRYVATFASSEDVGLLSYAAACSLAATTAEQQAVLGDGAEWIKTQAEEHFPDATKILDWPHLWRKMRDAVRACRPGQKARAKAWRREVYEQLFPALWQGDVEAALLLLQACRSLESEPISRLEEAISYLQTQRSWIGNYQQLRADGYPVGSGLVERAVALVINRRMKRQGMRWKRDNATAVVALRVEIINREWDIAA